jgi:metal-dependent hydrolase (beta-lactamase superfamily II)
MNTLNLGKVATVLVSTKHIDGFTGLPKMAEENETKLIMLRYLLQFLSTSIPKSWIGLFFTLLVCFFSLLVLFYPVVIES